MSSKQVTRRQFGTGVISSVLLPVAGCLGNDDHGDHDGYTVEIIDRSNDEAVADYHGHWHGDLPSIPLGEHISLGATFEDEDGNETPLGDGEYQFDAQRSDDEGEVISTEAHGDHVHIHGEITGYSSVIFQLVDGDHVEWETSGPIDIEVMEE